MTKFVSKLDKAVFANEQEAFEHFKNTYLVEHKEDVTVSEEIHIYNALADAFPDAIVSVTYINNSWGKYNIKLDFGDVNFDEYLYQNDKESYSVAHENISDFIELFRNHYRDAKYILNEVKSKYDFKDFQFSRYHSDYGNGHYLDFYYKTHDDYSEYKTYESHKDINVFINEFKEHFITELEGECEVRYDEGYFDDYYVNGLAIGGILRRAKDGRKVKIKLL
ncbi:hypothetical protein GCM10023310_69320 [Paenibacillus vulneris]|uniref:Large polyvalent protein associated domain-containing protein n=1 Tax=Paenibacillus vulneris TaxID=1133364 RepID=A0ABW3UJ60_9BACL